MFNPSELEGEVDHSFFDSDCDDSKVSRDGGEKVEKGLKTGKEGPQEGLYAKQTENIKGSRSPRTDGTKKRLKPVENNSSSRAERKENSCQSKQENRIRATSVSSIACTSDKVINNSSESEEDSNLHSKRRNGTFMALLTESRGADYKDVYESPNETEEEALPSNAKHRNKQSPKKRIRNRHTRSPSPTSTETSVDADSESSCSSSNGRSSLESPTLPRFKQYSLSPGVTNTQVGSAGSQDVLYSRTEESEDTLTDVSPLCSPGSSPLQSDLNNREAREGSPTERQQQQEESVPSSGLSNIHQDEVSDQDADECSLSSESQLRGKLLFHCRGGRNRKNYSFTNDEVRRIDCENQRLLRELSRLSPRPRPGSTAGKKTHMASNSPHVRLSHSALNRQREQQRIERENLAFLKRLESVKPTPGIKRSEQLEDYQRQVGYLGAPSYPICMPTTKKDRSASKTPKAGPRPASSAHHSTRAVSTTTDSGSTPRSKKLNAAKPAWC